MSRHNGTSSQAKQEKKRRAHLRRTDATYGPPPRRHKAKGTNDEGAAR